MLRGPFPLLFLPRFVFPFIAKVSPTPIFMRFLKMAKNAQNGSRVGILTLSIEKLPQKGVFFSTLFSRICLTTADIMVKSMYKKFNLEAY